MCLGGGTRSGYSHAGAAGPHDVHRSALRGSHGLDGVDRRFSKRCKAAKKGEKRAYPCCVAAEKDKKICEKRNK